MSFVRYVKLRVPAGAAKPGPAIGQALGPLGINMAEFVKQFNDQTVDKYVKDTPLRVLLSAFSDRTFTFQVRTPPASYLILRAAGMAKGPEKPNPDVASGYITPEAVYEIAKIKAQDDNVWHLPLKGIAQSIVGQARAMGIRCVEEEDIKPIVPEDEQVID